MPLSDRERAGGFLAATAVSLLQSNPELTVPNDPAEL